jgi:hypothetical protein
MHTLMSPLHSSSMHGIKVLIQVHRNVPVRIPALMSQLSHNSMHGNNVPLQVHRNDPYRQMELSGMKTSHINNTGNII